jgi:hypothetical protein
MWRAEVAVAQLEQVLDDVTKALDDHGLKPTDHGSDGERVFHRQRFEITKFALVDTFLVAKAFDPAPDIDGVKRFSAHAMTLARRHKFFLPVGLGSALVTYPVLVMSKVPDELSDFVRTWSPKHWSAFEFPVLLDAATRELHHYTDTPIWGMAYYQGFREEVARLLGG